MSQPFTHLHVASGYSLRHGASTPAVLVETAAAHGMEAIALTDRDGLYGAVKFVQACRAAGLAPLLGADLAVESTSAVAGLPEWADPGARPPPRRAPIRGGASVDPRHPRVTVLALAGDPDVGRPPGAGWGRLCRLVSATHLRGERGVPVASLDLVAQHAAVPPAGGPAALAVLLGPDSEVGRATLARRPDLAAAALDRWRAQMPAESLAIEVVCHHGPQNRPASLGHAARMLALAREAGVPAVLANAVRHATPDGAATVDVLDAARRLVPLHSRHLDRVSAQGYLASPEQMAATAAQVAAAAGETDGGRRLMADTEALARRCRLDPVADLGVGVVRFPEAHVLGLRDGQDALEVLRGTCEAAIDRHYPQASPTHRGVLLGRLRDELETISVLGYAAYFLIVELVCDLIREMGVRVAARGSGAGSLVNHLLGISGVDPIRHGLLMERFLSPLRAQLPDIDIDVESARRTEVYQAILDRFGAERVTCVSMMDTYRVRHAIRDAGAALGMPPGEIDAIAKAFPHIRARDVRHALRELPELAASGLTSSRLNLLFDLVERLDGLPRHVALHPCGVILSDARLLDRTPVEASWQGFPMSQFDKDDVEDLGLLKLDVLGIRMQSAMAFALDEVVRVDGPDAVRAGGHPESAVASGTGYLDPATGRIDLDAVPHDDETTFELIRSARTLGLFQIESPGQRELVGRFAPQTFDDLIIDISLFRPGPVKSDMVTPFLMARQGWVEPEYVHSSLEETLRETSGVVVFHEQVLHLVSVTTGCDLAQADEVRRAMGSPAGQAEVEAWWRPLARRLYDEATVERIWAVLVAFASFGFCKAHAAAFALPTYHSAWLKAHHPAAFLAGVLTHDPGMYPKRLILDDARNHGIAVLPLDVNASVSTYRVERAADGTYGIRLALADVKGMSEAEISRTVAGQPYHSLADYWHRAQVSRPVVERLVVAGAFDALHSLGASLPVRRPGLIGRRDLLLQVAELDRWTRSTGRAASRRSRVGMPGEAGPDDDAVRSAAARQSQAPRAVLAATERPVQLALDLGDAPDEPQITGLPEMDGAERVRAELEVLGLDASRHVVDFYVPLMEALGVTRARDVLSRRNRAELLVAGVKVATQTPPVRSGRRVIFLTLDDATGPVDATFFEDVQGPYAATVFHSWLLVVRGLLRRTGPRGVSLRATGAWELPALWDTWIEGGLDAVHEVLAGVTASRASRRGVARLPVAEFGGGFVATPEQVAEHEAAVAAATGLPAGDRQRAGGMGGDPEHLRRVLVHASGFRQSPYADIKPAGDDARDTRRMLAAEGSPGIATPRDPSPPRKLWHASPGSSGR